MLSALNGSDDLRLLSDEQKLDIAEELREYIVRTVSANGGHLAPNLGVIELTIALLATGDFPRDSIIFDVGHQSYAWKILTGRFEAFPTLRQKGGLSGFPKREESDYDAFNTGHSSTSISAALGLARAKRMKGDLSKTMALIGDGALGGGMAFEALSDAGQGGENLLVILNDNQMCIDQAVGGMARHLEQLRTNVRYIRMKTVWEERLGRFPVLGKPLINMLVKIKRRWRSWRRETGVLFEQLGFRYYGPVDGHALQDLERHLRAVRLVRGPVLLHVITTKGKGYCYAEDEPEIFHGISPFDTKNGRTNGSPNKGETFSQLFGKTLIELAQERDDIVAITAAMAQGTGLIPFYQAFPSRFFDVGIAEQHAVTMGAGMAQGGLRPFVALYSTFMQRAVDQILHDVCLQNLPVTFMIDRAGLVGGDGDTHQGIYDLSIALSLPNLTVMAPSSAEDLQAMLHYALKHEGPLLIRYPNEQAPRRGDFEYPSDLNTIEWSDFQTLRPIQKGNDLTVVALGVTLTDSEAAVSELSKRCKNVTIELFSCVTAAPFDYESVIKSVYNTGRLLLVEDGIETGGFSEVIASEIARRVPGVMIEYAAVRNPLAGQATRNELKEDEGLDKRGLIDSMDRLLSRKTKH